VEIETLTELRFSTTVKWSMGKSFFEGENDYQYYIRMEEEYFKQLHNRVGHEASPDSREFALKIYLGGREPLPVATATTHRRNAKCKMGI
jgi:hypothetical protein